MRNDYPAEWIWTCLFLDRPFVSKALLALTALELLGQPYWSGHWPISGYNRKATIFTSTIISLILIKNSNLKGKFIWPAGQLGGGCLLMTDCSINQTDCKLSVSLTIKLKSNPEIDWNFEFLLSLNASSLILESIIRFSKMALYFFTILNCLFFVQASSQNGAKLDCSCKPPKPTPGSSRIIAGNQDISVF